MFQEILDRGPAATLLIFLAVVFAGVVSAVNPDELSFQDWFTLSTAVAGGLAVGRGLSAKGDVAVHPEGAELPLLERLNALPLATILLYVQAALGAVAVLTTDSLEWSAYFPLIFGAGAVTSVGRGIASYKKDRDPLMNGLNDPAYLEHVKAANAAIPGEAKLEGPEGTVPGG